jgi:methylated-DNA-protein-cysteine methyltransferase-like protein
MKNGTLPFTDHVKKIIRAIPAGRVATYGQVAALGGNHRAARQVAWILHSSSGKEKLPWHRVINSRGRISLRRGSGFEEQKRRLRAENVGVKSSGQVDLRAYQWRPAGIHRSGKAVLSKEFREFEKLLDI